VPSIALEKQIRSVFEQDLPDMIGRLDVIQKVRNDKEGYINSPAAMNFLNEAYHCHLWGNFFASITMVCAAFETLLKTQVKGGTFEILLSNAYESNLITETEYDKLTELRKFRNTLIHFKNKLQLDILDRYVEDLGEISGDMRYIYQKSDSAIKLTHIFNRIQKNMAFMDVFRTKVKSFNKSKS